MKRMLLGSVAVLTCILLVPAAVMAQNNNDRGRGGTGGPGGPGGPGGFGGPFGGGGVLGLVIRDEVQQELQLVDEQKDKVQKMADDMRDKLRDDMRDMFSQMRDLSEEERRAKFDEIRTKFEKVNADMEAQLQKALLPHQFERLKQIDLQSRLQRGGSYALTNGELAKTLNLTDEQKEKLEKRAAEVQQELQTQIRQLQADARKKVLDVLTPEQRAQLEKMMGDQFDLPEQRFDGGRFRGRGGDRGPGRGETGRPSENRSRTTNESI